MDTQPIANCCPRCQTPLPPDAPQGLCPKCLFATVAKPTEAGQPTGRPAPPSIGEIAAAFPQLEILEFIGQGGMGFVFKARQPKLDRLVALKILPQSLAADPTFAERFNREAKLLARLNHPGIVTVHDFGVAFSEGRAGSPLPAASEDNSERRARSDAPYQSQSQFYYLLMEFVDGVNLRQAMQAGRFTPDQALAIVPKICEALQFAHNEGILHRDIKPENILLDAKGRVKIADFGIAKLMGGGRAGSPLPAAESPNTSGAQGTARPTTELTEAGKTLGSPNYMAPEQLEHPGEVDHRADIYSLGVVFYEMLTGELPLGRFAPPSQKSAADPRVDEVVLRALEKERERRQHSAGEVRTQVETIVATPDSSSSRGDEAQTEKSEIGNRKSEMSPRFSSTAIVGACWAAFFVVILTLYFISKIFPHGFSGHSLLMAYGIIIVGGITILLGLTAPFGTTILGWVAVSQIRRSARKLYGLWLAVFDGLLFPLIALDFGILLLGSLAWRAWAASLGWDYHDLSIAILTILVGCACAVLDFLIIRAVWRAVNKGVAGGSNQIPAVGKPSNLKLTESGTAKILLPAFLTVAWHAVILMVTFGFFAFVVPRFSEVFAHLAAKLPLLTSLTITLTHAIQHGVWFLFPMLLVLDAGICILTQYLAGRWLRNVWSALVVCGCGVMVLFAGVSLYLPLSSLAEKVSSSTPAAAQNLSFGPVIERVVGVNGATNSFIDFDDGRVGALPKMADNPDLKDVTGLQQMARLMARAGWDGGGVADNPMDEVPPELLEDFAAARREALMQSGFTNLHTSYRGLGCFETATERVGNEQWEQMAAGEITAELSHVFPLTNGNYLAARSDEPTTWLFKTREGGTGILQITGFTENPRGVKLRYKLVQTTIPPQQITENRLLGEWQFDARRTIMVLDSSHVYRLKAEDGRTTFGEWKLAGNRLITIGQAWVSGAVAIKTAVTNDTRIKELTDSRMVLQNWGGPATTLTRVTNRP